MKTVSANVYIQRDPIPVRTVRVGNDEYTEYSSVIEFAGIVTGASSGECWKLAREYAKHPVMEWQ